MGVGSDGGYRQAIDSFASGVCIVTAESGGRRHAMTASALTSVSLDPVLLLVCFAGGSDTGAAVRASGRFGLSVLQARGGQEIANRCARKAGEDDRLAGVETFEPVPGAPLVVGALAAFACDVESVVGAADVDIVVGRVRHVEEHDDPGEPLLWHAGSYRRITTL